MDTFIILRNLTFIFASLMLIKYYIFLLLAPFYPVKESLRRLRWEKGRVKGEYKAYKPKISVIIPARNEEVGVIRSIESLLNNTYHNTEIIVVNDGSTDQTETIVKDFIEKSRRGKDIPRGMSVRYYAQPNGGKGTALNHGLKKATGEIVVTMDADSVFDASALENLIPYFADPTIDAVVGNVRISRNHTLIGYIQQLEYLFGFYFKRSHAVMNAEYIFGGACSAFRRDTFTKLGLFSTTNKTEDIEMSMRIRYHGFKCAFAENVVCFTEGASTFMSLINQRLRWKKGRFDTFLKYRALFFSIEKRHNKFLAWLVLPYALLSELQLLFEPIAVTLLLAYSVISGDYLSLAIGAMFIFVIYFVNAVFSYRHFRPGLLLYFFFTWPLFYTLVWIEYLALIKGSFMVLRGHEVVWQQWQRRGVKLVSQKSYA